MNTNLMIFNQINDLLRHNPVSLQLLKCDAIEVSDKKRITYEEYTHNPDLVHAIEQLLIYSYRHQDQCVWNRG
jgi:hypothetical protein